MKKEIIVFISLVLLLVITSACQKQEYNTGADNTKTDVSAPIEQGLDEYDQTMQGVDDQSLDSTDQDLQSISDL